MVPPTRGGAPCARKKAQTRSACFRAHDNIVTTHCREKDSSMLGKIDSMCEIMDHSDCHTLPGRALQG